jgi:glycosyltransferase involved in cell wall biosynthesis
VSGLRALGCEATVIASGDSKLAAEVISAVPRSLYAQMEAGTAADYSYYEQQQLRLALEQAPSFDVIHSHIGAAGYVLSAIPDLGARVLHTVHTPVLGDLQWYVEQHPGEWFATVSEFQARKLRNAGARRVTVIPNAIDVARFSLRGHAGDGLVFLGRMEAVKGPDLAVQVARALGRPLTLAGPIVEQDFFQRTIVPYLSDAIQYVGVLDHGMKNKLLGESACALLPFRGDEPFGLVAIEAMACSTPVVTLARGALPEIVEPGLTGYIAPHEDGLAALVEPAAMLNRAAIRTRVEARFDIRIAASAYYDLYRQIVHHAAIHAASREAS